jgi:CO/xanthine dehydrogenase Mo-binding subunit
MAPERGAPFRPLYGDRIRFSRQPTALVVAEEWDIARFAASLVRVEYAQEMHTTDVFGERERAVPLDVAADPAEKPFANIAEYHVPTNADIQDIQVIFVDEPDQYRQPARHQGAWRDRYRLQSRPRTRRPPLGRFGSNS